MTYTHHIRVMDAVDKAPTGRAPVGQTSEAPESKKSGGALVAILCVCLFVLALPTETGAWYWAGLKTGTLVVSGVRSVIPQYTLWAVLPLAILLHINAFGLKYYKKSVGLFLPFLLVGIVSGINGVFPINSIRLIIFWFACASVGCVSAGGLTERQGIKLLFYTFFIEMFLSIVLALLFKSAGVEHDSRVGGGGTAWRGVFNNRIALGGVAGWCLLLALYRKEVGRIAAVCMAACALLCLYEAHAAGPIIAAAASLGFVLAVMALRQTQLSATVKASVLMLGSIAAAIVVTIGMPLILKALNRDVTLSGRTEIWQVYIPKALEHPILGQGPGSFSSPSPITAELFYRLVSYGAIRTPHNMFIAALGDSGFIGLFALVATLFYIGFVLPFRAPGPTTLIASAGAILIMTNGLAETDMVFIPGPSLFILIMLLCIRRPAPGSESTTPRVTPSSPAAAARPGHAPG